MPLTKSPSKKAVGSNIAEFHQGPTFASTASKFGKGTANKQAIAVALDIQRKAKKRKFAEGGAVAGPTSSVALIAKQQYDKYAQTAMENGDTPLPFDQWATQNAVAGQGAVAGQRPTTTPVGSGIVDRLRAMFKFADGGAVDEQLLDPEYYQSDMIPPATAQLAARGAGDRMIGQALGAGTDADSRARLARLQALIARLRGQGPAAAGQAPTSVEPVGGRAELFDRLRAMNAGSRQYAEGGPVVDRLRTEWESGAPYRAAQARYHDSRTGERAQPPETFEHWRARHPDERGGRPPPADDLNSLALSGQLVGQYASGGAIHHVDPGETGGFGHIYDDDIYSYADGGPVGMPAGPAGMPAPAPAGPLGGPQPSAPGVAPPNATAQATGALATLGNQLLNERQALQQSYSIPPPPQPAGGAPPLPGGAPAAGPPEGGGGSAVGQALAAGPQNVDGTLQAALTRGMAAGGRIDHGALMKFALRDPRMQRKYCGGGPVHEYADGGAVAREIQPSDDQLAKLQRLMVALRAGQARKGNFGLPPVPTRGGVTFRG